VRKSSGRAFPSEEQRPHTVPEGLNEGSDSTELADVLARSAWSLRNIRTRPVENGMKGFAPMVRNSEKPSRKKRAHLSRENWGVMNSIRPYPPGRVLDATFPGI
jgi:hypothetical protein